MRVFILFLHPFAFILHTCWPNGQRVGGFGAELLGGGQVLGEEGVGGGGEGEEFGEFGEFVGFAGGEEVGFPELDGVEVEAEENLIEVAEAAADELLFEFRGLVFAEED